MKDVDTNGQVELDPQPAYMQIGVEEQIRHCEHELSSLTGGSVIAEYLDSLDPSVRGELIDLYHQEIAALRALDLSTATAEQIKDIISSYVNSSNEVISRVKGNHSSL